MSSNRAFARYKEGDLQSGDRVQIVGPQKMVDNFRRRYGVTTGTVQGIGDGDDTTVTVRLINGKRLRLGREYFEKV